MIIEGATQGNRITQSLYVADTEKIIHCYDMG